MEYNYVFVNKNSIIPEIIYEKSYNNILKIFYNFIKNQNANYCQNVYIVKLNNNEIISIIFYKKNNFFEVDKNNITNMNININNIDNQQIYEKFKNFIKNDNINVQIKNDNMNVQIKNNVESNINIQIKNNVESNINIIEDNNQNCEIDLEKEEKKKKIIIMCEEVKQLYNLQVIKIKKIQTQINNIDKKIKNLIKKRNEEIVSNIILIKNEYDAYLKIKNNFENIKNFEIPILFLSKYEYINNIIKNPKYKSYYDEIEKIDTEKLFIEQDVDNINPNIIKYSKEYLTISKNLNYKFSHDWDYLEHNDDM